MISKKLSVLIITALSIFAVAQDKPGMPSAASIQPSSSSSSEGNPDYKPNGKRIRRHLTMVVGLQQDEEFLIPDRPTVLRGRTEFFDMERISGTDMFRITPKKVGSGIATLHDKKTNQILVEIRFDVRDDATERTMREVQSLLGDIEGIEYKIISGMILIDGYVLLPRDLVRIAQVTANYPPDKVKSLASLSPVARQRIANFIANDVNNPEVKITAVGDYIKLEGQVNSLEEKQRIKSIVSLYLPDLVVDKSPDTNSPNIQIFGRKNTGKIEDLIVDLITIKKDDEKVEPPPKLIQVVAHFVKFSDSYSKKFSFEFAPAISANASGESTPATSIADTARLLNNLLPKLQWAKSHGFAKVLDTASILIQDKKQGVINRTVQLSNLVAGANGALVQNPTTPATLLLDVTPRIVSERSGLIEMPIKVSIISPGNTDMTTTNVSTVISVRDRQSAAFGGVIRKNTDTAYGAPAKPDAIITLQAAKNYDRSNSQFVVFVTPIIKSSASTGVEQVKKKFRLRD